MILDMGEPVKIVDVAERFAMEHDAPLEIVFAGLRPNEKLHEDLISNDERGVRKHHDLIERVDVPPISPSQLRTGGIAPSADDMARTAHHAYGVTA